MSQVHSTHSDHRPAPRSSIASPEARDALRQRQAALGSQYRRVSESAAVSDHARTRAKNRPSDGPLDPLHTWVMPGEGSDITLPVGLHSAVGGLGDLPVPGDLLCAALAACTDSTVRVVANALGVELIELAVDVSADVDVRGTLLISKEVPVAFQAMHIRIELRAVSGTPPDRLRRLVQTAEQCCVVLRTLRDGVPIDITCDHEENA